MRRIRHWCYHNWHILAVCSVPVSILLCSFLLLHYGRPVAPAAPVGYGYPAAAPVVVYAHPPPCLPPGEVVPRFANPPPVGSIIVIYGPLPPCP